MPRKPRTSPTDDLIDQLLQEYSTPEQILEEGGLLKQLTKRVLEPALDPKDSA